MSEDSSIDSPNPGGTGPAPMSEAEECFVERLTLELERILGGAIAIGEVRIHGDGPVAVTVGCAVDGRNERIEVEADDLLEAYRRVVASAAELRLAAAWSRIVRQR